MRVIAKMDGARVPAMLCLIIHGAPHRRMPTRARGSLAVMQQYREEIRKGCEAAGIRTPIDTTVDLWVQFIDPTSPDYDNLLVALYQALDGKTLRGPGILADDKLVGTIRRIGKSYTSVP